MGFFSEYKQVNKLLQQYQQVVFYAESRHYYRYFERLTTDLLARGAEICYITSDAGDPLLTNTRANMKVVHVKWMLGFLFSKIRTNVLVMTMPDLGNFLFKRSPGVGSYVYVFHAAVSTFQQYRRDAFFQYDAIFCTGNYQVSEIRKAEEVNGSEPKSLIEYGYPLFDELKRETGISEMDNTGKSTILVAPSWFTGCIFNTCIEELLFQLSNLPYHVVLRSHPEYEKRNKKSFLKIKKMLAKHPAMRIDDEHDVMKSLPKADMLITDRSGIAFEFAFGVGRPVLFIDTPLKEVNPRWRELPCIEPIENRLRYQLGVAVAPGKLNEIPEKIKELKILQNGFAGKMEQLGKDIFFNSDESFKNGVEFILKKLNKT